MSQSRKASLIETTLSTAIGFSLSWTLSWFLLPAFGLHPSASSNTLITVAFTVLSLARGYVLRRVFNHLHRKGILL